MWKLYDELIEGIPEGLTVEDFAVGKYWSFVKAGGNVGLAMTTSGDSRPWETDSAIIGLPLKTLAHTVKSWNLPEASLGMAAINAWYNSLERLEKLHCSRSKENSSIWDLPIEGKRVGLVGHLRLPQEILDTAKSVRILERNPQDGDYPDCACEYILPECEVIVITGSAFVNKTMPRLLALSRHAAVILTGPTVPLSETMFSYGVNRLAGMIVLQPDDARFHVLKGAFGPPHFAGERYCFDV